MAHGRCSLPRARRVRAVPAEHGWLQSTRLDGNGRRPLHDSAGIGGVPAVPEPRRSSEAVLDPTDCPIHINRDDAGRGNDSRRNNGSHVVGRSDSDSQVCSARGAYSDGVSFSKKGARKDNEGVTPLTPSLLTQPRHSPNPERHLQFMHFSRNPRVYCPRAVPRRDGARSKLGFLGRRAQAPRSVMTTVYGPAGCQGARHRPCVVAGAESSTPPARISTSAGARRSS
jgi:hypothetical protein